MRDPPNRSAAAGPAPLLAVIACLAPGLACAQISVLGSLAYTSDYVHRGLTQSSGEPAVQAGVGIRIPQGLYANLWGSTIKTDELGPDFGDGSGYEVDAVLGWSRPFGVGWNWNLNGGRYAYFAEHRNLDYDYTEFAAALGFRERLRLSLAWAPMVTDHTRRIQPEKLEGPRWVAELSGEWPLTRWLSATGGAGYNDARDVSDVTYVFWSAGLNLRYRRYALGLAAYGTDSEARARWPDGRADERFVVTLIGTFG